MTRAVVLKAIREYGIDEYPEELEELADAITAALVESGAVSEWHPISDPPPMHNRLYVRIIQEGDEYYTSGWMNPYGNWNLDNHFLYGKNITHWTEIKGLADGR